MGQNERRIIDDLFERLRNAEEQSAPRDPEAEVLIARYVAAHPAAPYYMAQAIVFQQDALARAQARIGQLEGDIAERRSGGFLGRMFGAGEDAQEPPAPARGDRASQGFDHARRGGAGGGFLAGAMQTALGVAGGFLIAHAIFGLLSPDDAPPPRRRPAQMRPHRPRTVRGRSRIPIPLGRGGGRRFRCRRLRRILVSEVLGLA